MKRNLPKASDLLFQRARGTGMLAGGGRVGKALAAEIVICWIGGGSLLCVPILFVLLPTPSFRSVWRYFMDNIAVITVIAAIIATGQYHRRQGNYEPNSHVHLILFLQTPNALLSKCS